MVQQLCTPGGPGRGWGRGHVGKFTSTGVCFWLDGRVATPFEARDHTRHPGHAAFIPASPQITRASKDHSGTLGDVVPRWKPVLVSSFVP